MRCYASSSLTLARPARIVSGHQKPIIWDECEGWIYTTQNNYSKYGYGMSAMILKATGETIGFIEIVVEVLTWRAEGA